MFERLPVVIANALGAAPNTLDDVAGEEWFAALDEPNPPFAAAPNAVNALPPLPDAEVDAPVAASVPPADPSAAASAVSSGFLQLRLVCRWTPKAPAPRGAPRGAPRPLPLPLVAVASPVGAPLLAGGAALLNDVDDPAALPTPKAPRPPPPPPGGNMAALLRLKESRSCWREQKVRKVGDVEAKRARSAFIGELDRDSSLSLPGMCMRDVAPVACSYCPNLHRCEGGRCSRVASAHELLKVTSPSPNARGDVCMAQARTTRAPGRSPALDEQGRLKHCERVPRCAKSASLQPEDPRHPRVAGPEPSLRDGLDFRTRAPAFRTGTPSEWAPLRVLRAVRSKKASIAGTAATSPSQR